ncbi:MerR family transcriptional regulator [Mesoplasma syrphidae]|uniref:MerR family transcriptional regulator n=1 Tax=Mesoplasma syrphidae TaxID=225999 RepID=A0A2K9C1U3_9MOLU|nr:MerR family transcriptional regulator [Mesoplasma syrphidae]AUF83439.1 MerR family transcriptional regulator [Mesoplasma syrphidae]
MPKRYYIKEIANKFNIPEYLLRYYDEKGVITKFKRDENDYRYMFEDDLIFVKTVLCLKKTNMPLKEIIKYIELVDQGEITLESRQAMILKQEKVVLKKQHDLEEQIAFINYKKDFYEQAIKNKK